MQACAKHLLTRLEKIYESGNPEDKVIYAHSMGAMLLLKIFFEQVKLSKFFLQSRIVFIQAPLNIKTVPYLMYTKFRFLFLAFMFLYRYSYYFWLDDLLVKCKKAILKIKRHSILLVFLDWFLNLGMMYNTCAGTKTLEFSNLVEYYKEWKNFDFEKHSNEEIKHGNFKNFYFTCGQPDLFEDRKRLEKLVKLLGARLICLPFGFHSPQHMFWWQQKLSKIALL